MREVMGDRLYDQCAELERLTGDRQPDCEHREDGVNEFTDDEYRAVADAVIGALSGLSGQGAQNKEDE